MVSMGIRLTQLWLWCHTSINSLRMPTIMLVKRGQKLKFPCLLDERVTRLTSSLRRRSTPHLLLATAKTEELSLLWCAEG